jgi:hypothetical protein
MAHPARARIIIAVIGIVVVAMVGITVVRRLTRERDRTITATILAIDPQARTASIEFVHPKTGKTLELEGRVPEECDIQIDGRPAKLSDLRVGERAEVNGTIHANITLSANWVRVTRAAKTTPVPGTTPATTATSGPAAGKP